MSHPSHDDLAAFSLGAIDGREERSVRKHLDGCESCATEMRERLLPAVAVLGESVEQLEPPPELRQSLMAAVHQEASTAGAGAGGGRPARGDRSRIGAFLLRPATGLAAIALGIAGVAGYMVAEGDPAPTETIPLAQASSGVGGSLVVDDGGATLHMHGMDPLAKGDVYQVWVADPSGVRPSAAFVPHDDGTATAAVPEAAGDVDEVMITHEPRAGRRTPTLERTVFDHRFN